MYCSRPVSYRRRLPHKHFFGATFSITWRLHGSLPKSALKRLQAKRAEKLKALKIKNLTPLQTENETGLIEAAYYLELDDILDKITSGPHWLKNPEIAAIVIAQLRKYDGVYYQLDTFCVMSNHVHVILDFSIQIPEREEDFEESAYVNVDRVMQLIKGTSSYLSNKVLGRNGPFWQAESWDRYIRNERHYWNTRHYFMENPVKAGICKNREEYPFSWER